MIGISIIALGSLIIIPVGYQLYSNPQMQCTSNPSCSQAQGTIYNVAIIAGPLLFLGAAIVNMYARAARRDQSEAYFG